MDVHAAGEVFYGHRPGDWHLAIGWPEPISRRVRAKALKLLDWDAYLVITGRDLELAERTFPGTALAVGYRTGIDKRGKWGPVKGVLAVWVAGLYLVAVAVLHRRGDRWPVGRTLSFVVLGMGSFVFATASGLGRYDIVSMNHVLEHVVNPAAWETAPPVSARESH